MSKKQRSVAERIEIGRHKDRPNITDYISLIFEDFIELHGDRAFGDDSAICGGIARFQGAPVTVIGHKKGKNTTENIKMNFGMPYPEGYRKALRLMRQAEKFHRPILCFVDTPGAHCGVGAEQRGQGEAIARNLYEMMGLRVPIISVITGEGGSGGALALAVANEVYMLENAVYSIISPKGFASILWKDPTRELEAAEQLRMTAPDLLEFGVIEKVIAEPRGGAHEDANAVAKNLKKAFAEALARMADMTDEQLVNERYQKFRNIGVFGEETITEKA